MKKDLKFCKICKHFDSTKTESCMLVTINKWGPILSGIVGPKNVTDILILQSAERFEADVMREMKMMHEEYIVEEDMPPNCLYRMEALVLDNETKS